MTSDLGTKKGALTAPFAYLLENTNQAAFAGGARRSPC